MKKLLVICVIVFVFLAACSPTTPKEGGKWKVGTEDSSLSGKIITLSLKAERPVKAWLEEPTPTLIIRCQAGKLDIFIHNDTAANPELGSDEITISTKFDGEEVVVRKTGKSTDDKALFLRGAGSIIRELVDTDTMYYGFTPFNAPPVETSFDLRGLGKVIDPLMAACP